MRIVAAAIKFRGEVFSLPAPKRHSDIIRLIHEKCRSAVTQEIQGFVTDDGTFVDRVEAGRIAIAAGQLKELPVPPDLYSEDLW